MRITVSASVTLQQLDQEMDRAWSELQREGGDPELGGIDLTHVLPLGRRDVVVARPDSQGVDPITTAIVVSFAPVAAKVSSDLWSKLLLPALRRRFGEDAVRVERDAE